MSLIIAYHCLDNDPAGREATNNLIRKYIDKGYIAYAEPSEGKDYNEDLLNYTKRVQPQKAHNYDISL